MLKRKVIVKSLLASLKKFLILKIVPKAASEFVFLLSFAVNGDFSPLYIHSRLSEQCQFKITGAFGTNFFSESQAAT